MAKLVTINLCPIHNGILIEASHNGNGKHPFGRSKTIYASDLVDAASRLETIVLDLCESEGRDVDPVHPAYEPVIGQVTQRKRLEERLAERRPQHPDDEAKEVCPADIRFLHDEPPVAVKSQYRNEPQSQEPIDE